VESKPVTLKPGSGRTEKYQTGFFIRQTFQRERSVIQNRSTLAELKGIVHPIMKISP